MRAVPPMAAGTATGTSCAGWAAAVPELVFLSSTLALSWVLSWALSRALAAVVLLVAILAGSPKPTIWSMVRT
ncbi:hypothetical protein D5H75_36670, partial [Bailinhaonella thermotolerans]